jgi:hypothetical protein
LKKKNNQSKKKMSSICWTCDEVSTHKVWRDALGEYELTCDKCHKEQYPEDYCQTADCQNQVSTISQSEGDAPRHYCEKCYLEDQEDDCNCESDDEYSVTESGCDNINCGKPTIYQLVTDFNELTKKMRAIDDCDSDEWDDLRMERSSVSADISLAISRLPPPRQDLLDDQLAYQTELFNQIMTIPTAQKTIGKALDKVFAHPCAKMIDRVFTTYWHDYHVSGEMTMLKQFIGEEEYKGMLFNRLPLRMDDLIFKVAKTHPQLFTQYISKYAREFRSSGNPSDAHWKKVCEEVTKTKRGKIVKARAERLFSMLQGWHNGSYDRKGLFNPDMLINLYLENKYQSPIQSPWSYYRKNVLGLHWRGVIQDINERHWNRQTLEYPDEYWNAELEYMSAKNCRERYEEQKQSK